MTEDRMALERLLEQAQATDLLRGICCGRLRSFCSSG